MAESTPHWLQARDALALTRSLGNDALAEQNLTRWARDQIVDARCRRWIWNDSDKPFESQNETDITPVPPGFWDEKFTNFDWDEGYFEHRESSGFAGILTIAAYGVEFNGDEIVRYRRGDSAKFENHWPIRLISPVQSELLNDPVKSASTATAPRSDGPPVSKAALEEWWVVFSKHNPAATEPQAQASAEAMFPGKTVTRVKIRELRGEQKRGPKPRTAE
jgi:hypothetical protein